MDVSVFVYRNHHKADIEGYDLVYHHSQERFLQYLMISYLHQSDILDHQNIVILISKDR